MPARLKALLLKPRRDGDVIPATDHADCPVGVESTAEPEWDDVLGYVRATTAHLEPPNG